MFIYYYKNSIAYSISRKQWERFWTPVPEADVNSFVENSRRSACIRAEIEHLTLSFLAPNLKLVNLNDLNAFNNF